MSYALYQAVGSGRLQQVRYLTKNGVSLASLDRQNPNGLSLLARALHIEDGHQRRRMVQFLLSHGASPDQCDQATGRDALVWASYLGRSSEVRVLLEHPDYELELCKPDKLGMTPLHYACSNGDLETVRVLARLLKKYGTSVDMPYPNGRTPFLEASRLGYHEIADVLRREGGASPSQFDTRTFRTRSRWSEIGESERQEKQLEELVSEMMVRGSHRPHTSYQLRRRSLDTSPRRPLSTSMTSQTLSATANPGVSMVRAADGNAGNNRNNVNWMKPSSGTAKINGALQKLKSASSVRPSYHDPTQSGSHRPHTTEARTKGTRYDPTWKTWNRIQNIMDLSDKAKVVSESSFVPSQTKQRSTQSNPKSAESHRDPAPEPGASVDIVALMTAKAEQMSTSFRNTAKPRPLPPPADPPALVKLKRGSTLAYILKTTGSRRRPYSRSTDASSVRTSRSSRNKRHTVTFGPTADSLKGFSLKSQKKRDTLTAKLQVN